jgi:hypothetical protein
VPDNEIETVRDAIEAARADLAEPATDVDTTPAPVDESVQTVDTSTEVPTDTASAETAAEKADRIRDEAGRFTKKPTEGKAKTAVTPAPVAKASEGAVAKTPVTTSSEPIVPKENLGGQLAGTDKAPTSWRPLAREQWGKLPPEVREEWSKREKEMSGFVARNGEAAQFREQFQQVVGPYAGMIAASNSHPLQAVGNLLQTAATLRTGTAQEKAALTANLIKSYGIDIDALAEAMNGKQPQAQAQAFDPAMIDRIVEQKLQMARQQSVATKAQQDLAEFTANPPEFLDRVKPKMAGLLQGQVASNLKEAYDMAIGLDPEIRQVLDQRKAADAAKTAQAAALKARNAASSVRSSPAASPTSAAQPQTVREAIEAARKKVSGRV